MTNLDLTWLAVGIVCFWGVAVFLFLKNINDNVEEIKKQLNSKNKSESSVDLIRRYRDEYAEQGNDESNCVDNSRSGSK